MLNDFTLKIMSSAEKSVDSLAVKKWLLSQKCCVKAFDAQKHHKILNCSILHMYVLYVYFPVFQLNESRMCKYPWRFLLLNCDDRQVYKIVL